MIHIVTPSLAYGEWVTDLFQPANTPERAASIVMAGGRVLVPDRETARATLARCDVGDLEAKRLLDRALPAEPVESAV